jgi:hypothetical protein
MELTAVLANLVPSWRRGTSCARTRAASRVVVWRFAVRPSPADWLEGVVHGGPYEVQWQVWRRPAPVPPNSVGSIVVVCGVALQ